MLSQTEANDLLAMPKQFVHPPPAISLPPGAGESHELTGAGGREKFQLDLWRATIRLTKWKYQHRAQAVFILARLDLDGAPHTNPDGQQIPGSHLHVYREGYDDRWAYPLDPVRFSSPGDAARCLRDFCAICHIHPLPPFQEWIA